MKENNCLKLDNIIVDSYKNNRFPISVDKVNNTQLDVWNDAIAQIYEYGTLQVKKIYNSGKYSIDDYREEIYSEFRNIRDLIGPINGYPIIYRDLVEVVIGILVSERDSNDVCSIDVFRKLFERSIGLKVVIQKEIPQVLLDDEKKEFCYVKKSKRRISRIIEAKKEAVKPSVKNHKRVDVGIKTNIHIFDGVITCGHASDCETIFGYVELINSDGNIEKCEVILRRCKTCQKLFMSRNVYRTTKNAGVLIGRFIDDKKAESFGKTLINYKQESHLHEYGYNVGAKDNLSSQQRRKILDLVVKNRIYTTAEVTNFLQWLIENANKQKNKDMFSAISKWEDDKNYLIDKMICSRRK